ncbi:MAG: glycine cleavage system aminomethyltransferase GcvT [Pseudomonadota bacterium]
MSPDPLTTPLFEWHAAQGARMTTFGGYAMPLHYPLGVMGEHNATRAGAGLFDVSHMGQVTLRAPSLAGDQARRAAAAALEALAPMNFVDLAEGRQRYGVLTTDDGGVIDDFMAVAREDHLALVVNAANKQAVTAHLRERTPPEIEVELLDSRALLALQGPAAEAALAAAAPEAASALTEMRFMDARILSIGGAACLATRSGYTGEDGFEISIPNEHAAGLAEALVGDARVAPAGLGARDSLRLEAGLCLCGVDMDAETSPIEAALDWAIPKIRRPGGARAGGYPGAARLEREMRDGPARRRVGLKPEGRAPVRGGAPLFEAEDADAPLGVVSSGVFGPTVGGPCAMGYAPPGQSAPSTQLFAEVRGKRLPVRVVETPFTPARFKRR